MATRNRNASNRACAASEHAGNSEVEQRTGTVDTGADQRWPSTPIAPKSGRIRPPSRTPPRTVWPVAIGRPAAEPRCRPTSSPRRPGTEPRPRTTGHQQRRRRSHRTARPMCCRRLPRSAAHRPLQTRRQRPRRRPTPRRARPRRCRRRGTTGRSHTSPGAPAGRSRSNCSNRGECRSRSRSSSNPSAAPTSANTKKTPIDHVAHRIRWLTNSLHGVCARRRTLGRRMPPRPHRDRPLVRPVIENTTGRHSPALQNYEPGRQGRRSRGPEATVSRPAANAPPATAWPGRRWSACELRRRRYVRVERRRTGRRRNRIGRKVLDVGVFAARRRVHGIASGWRAPWYLRDIGRAVESGGHPRHRPVGAHPLCAARRAASRMVVSLSRALDGLSSARVRTM